MISENEIVEKTSELYVKYGIKSVSVDDVAFMLGISKKTLYEHIENKNVLIQKVVDNNLNDFFEDIINRIETEKDIFKTLCIIVLSAIRSVKKTNPSYVHDLKKYHSNEYRKIIEFRDNKFFKTFEKCIKSGIEKGLIREDTNIRFAFFNQMSKLSVFYKDTDFECAESVSAQKIYKLILNDIRGITTLKGHEIFDRNYEELLQLK